MNYLCIGFLYYGDITVIHIMTSNNNERSKHNVQLVFVVLAWVVSLSFVAFSDASVQSRERRLIAMITRKNGIATCTCMGRALNKDNNINPPKN